MFLYNRYYEEESVCSAVGLANMSYSGGDLVWTALTCLTIGIVWRFVRKRRQWSATIDRIPGPKGIPVFGTSLQLLTSRENSAKTSVGLMAPFAEHYPMMRLWNGPIPMVILIKAEAARVLLNSSKNIDKAFFYKYLTNWIGDGLLNSTGSKWQQRRKLITPSFHFRILENFLLVMNEQVDILVKVLDKKYQTTHNDEFDIYPFISRCTLDIICETAMGQGVNAQLNEDSEYLNAVNSMTQILKRRFVRPWLYPDWIFALSSLGRMERRALNIVHGFTNKVINQKRMKLSQSNGRKHNEPDDVLGRKRRVALLDMLLENSVEDSSGQVLTDEDIREEVDTFMFEGHDTTSVGIAWALYCIGQHDNVQQKIVDELDSIFGESDRDTTSDDLHNMKYLECVLKECMRLFPPVPGFGRTLTEDLDICGYSVPAGVMVLVSTYFIHRDPAHFPDPESFNPDRFLPQTSQDRDPFAYIPFSAGLRNCIGQKFAMMEEKVVISNILKRFHVTAMVEPDILSNLTDELVLRPIRGIKVQIKPRRI